MYSFINRLDKSNSNLICSGKDYEEVFRKGLKHMHPYMHYVIKEGIGKASTVLWECNITQEHRKRLS